MSEDQQFAFRINRNNFFFCPRHNTADFGRRRQTDRHRLFWPLQFLMQNTSMVSFDGGSASKVDDVIALPSHIQDGGYALLWQRYDNNKMAAICYSTSSTVQS